MPTLAQSALSFIDTYAETLGMDHERLRQLHHASRAAIELVVESNQKAGSSQPVAIEVFERGGQLFVEVMNRGVPFFLDTLGAHGEPFYEAAQALDKLSIENLGRAGQTVVMAMKLGAKAAERSLVESGTDSAAELDASQELTLRLMHPDEAASLSQLFYHVYEYNYIHEWVYYPEKVAQMVEEGKLISMVGGLSGGRLAGHVGLMRWNDDPRVFEPCLGVVDPRLKSRGLFKALFQKLMDRVSEIPMQYLFFDFVTNHDFSQRFVAKYSPCDLSLFVGCQSSETQAKLERLGIGQDSAEMDRYSLLYSIIPRVPHPFGKEVPLPNSLGELLGFLLEKLDMEWTPTSRFQVLGYEGDYQTHLQPSQQAVLFDLFEPGRKSAERILQEWGRLLRNGYQYAAIEVPVAVPGLAHLYDLLSDHGFFVSGFIPYHHSSRLGLRFQALGPTKVAWDDIKVHSPTARQLLEVVRKNYERNGLL